MADLPLIKVCGLYKSFTTGDTETTVLSNINLEVHSGEMLAIIGQSGSGKSTLMNILACLDSPSAGDYWIDGKHVKNLSPDARAALRRQKIGFIFQRYYLLNDLKARENVAIPAVYAGVNADTRLKRADELLTRLGLSERIHYRPKQLSGGQQQRVSIARALMNGGQIIFADEPTGALDSASGAEVMQILRELHADGHTIILVTHDPNIAASADRVIEIKDGIILSDITNKRNGNATETAPVKPKAERVKLTDKFGIERIVAAFTIAVRALMGHKLRAFLTMLGIIIGIASVVSMVALGQGTQKKVLENISGLGASTILIFPGAESDPNASRVRTLTTEDADILARQSFIDSATPVVSTSAKLHIDNRTFSASVTGIGAQFFQVQNLPITQGRALQQRDIDEYKAIGYLTETSAKKIFNHETPLGKVLLLNNVPVTIIGTIDTQKQAGFYEEGSISVWVPYTVAMSRLLRRTRISNLILRIADDVIPSVAEDAIKRILIRRHGREDFTLFNNDALREAITQTVQSLSLLISSIAIISLVVGGIGVMNIMLVSVTERTQEIGIRMAVGARRADIMQQFLIEAVLLCLIGGVLGIGLAYGIGEVIERLTNKFSMDYSTSSFVIAFLCSTSIGVLFGFLPARNASRLDPVNALNKE